MKSFPLRTFLTLAIISLGWLATEGHSYSARAAGGATTGLGKDPGVEEFVPSDMEKRQAKYASVSEDRARTIAGLLDVLQRIPAKQAFEDYDFGQRAYAIRMLGDMRAAEATSTLMDLIDTYFTPGGTALGGKDEQPVTSALVKIGNPASHMAVEYLAKDKSEKRAAMYVRVIAQVEGIDLGKAMVQMAADKEQDPAKKARLQAAIALFDKADQPIP